MSRIEVELVEHEPGPGEPAAPDGPGTSHDDARRRRLLWWLVLGAVVLVMALAVVQHVLDERRLAHLARFDHVPGVLVPLTDSVALATLDGVEEPGALVPAGPVMVTTSTDDTTTTITAYDRTTARRAWSRTVDLAPTTVASIREHDFPAEVWCRTLGEPGTARWGERLACVIESVSFPSDGNPAQLVVLRTSDGTVVAEREHLAEAWTTTGDLVVAATPERDDDGAETWTVRATTVAGDEVWTWTADEPVERENPTYSAALVSNRTGTLLSVSDRWWLLGDDGTLVREGGTPGTSAGLERGPAVVENPQGVVGTDGTVTASDTTTLVGTEGSAELTRVTGLRLQVDDASVPDLTWFVPSMRAYPDEAGTLTARSTATAQEVWTRDLVVHSALLLEGRLYVCTDDSLEALDARDGTTLWRVDRPSMWTWCDLATDGRAVITVEEGAELHAYDPQDGDELWATDFEAEGGVAVFAAGVFVTTPADGTTAALIPSESMGVVTR